MVKKEKLINVKVMTMTNELGSNYRLKMRRILNIKCRVRDPRDDVWQGVV